MDLVSDVHSEQKQVRGPKAEEYEEDYNWVKCILGETMESEMINILDCREKWIIHVKEYRETAQ